jgi:hypothetical protein
VLPRADGKFGLAVQHVTAVTAGLSVLKYGDEILDIETRSVRGKNIDDVSQRWDQCIKEAAPWRILRIRIFRPPAGTPSRPNVDHHHCHEPVDAGQHDLAFAVSRGAQDAALGTLRARALAHEHGRSMWADTFYAEQRQKEAALLALPTPVPELAPLSAALEAQADLRRITDVSKEVRALLQKPPDAGAAPMANAAAALHVGLSALPVVLRQYYRPTRLAARDEAERRRARFLDRVVEETVRFAAPAPVHDALDTRRPGVVVIGNWILARNKCGSKFPFKQYLEALSRRVIVVIGSEHMTSSACPQCGSYVGHTLKQHSTAVSQGVSYCLNKDCPTQGIFLNRDVSAAAAISHLFFHTMLWGGHGGKGAISFL